MTLLQKARFHFNFILYDARYSIRPVIGRILNILRRRKFTPQPCKRAILIITVKHFGYFPEENIIPYLTTEPDKAFLDIGANWGGYTLIMATKCKHVYAWEPSPKVFQQLKSNTAKHSNVILFQEALGDVEKSGKLFLHACSGHNNLLGGSSIDFIGETADVQIKTLDSHVFLERIGLIKIDTEGYEVPILKGAMKTILSHKPRLILEVHEPYEANTEEILKLLPSYRWKRCHKVPCLPNIQNQFHLIGTPK